MQFSLGKSRFLLIVLSLTTILVGCSQAKPTADPSLIWRVDLQKYEVKDKLEGVVVVKQYVGSTEEVRQQYPSEGKVFLIMKVSINKQGTDTTPFIWDELTVQDSGGNVFHRDSNDTFLEQFKYTPRITGLEIKFGEYEGWMCYEIPAEGANGSLTLIYSGEGSQQEIQIRK